MLNCRAFTKDVKREPSSPGPVTQRGDSTAVAATVGVEPGQVSPSRRRIPGTFFSRDFPGQAAGQAAAAQAAGGSFGQGNGSSHVTVPPSKAKAQRNWELHEIKILIAAKRIELERNTKINSRTKWTAIADYVRDHGVTNPIRDSNMCKKKWDKLLANWRKVFDYERDKFSRHTSYHDMTTHERREAALPMHFNHELYEEIKEWYAAGVEVDSSDANVMDSGNLVIPEKFPTNEDGPKHIVEGEGVDLDDEDVNHVPDPPTPGSSAHSPEAPHNVSPLPSVSRDRKRKSRSDSGEGSLPERNNLSINEALIDVIAKGIDSSAKSMRLIAEAGNNCATQMGRVADAMLQMLAYQMRDGRSE